MSSDESQELNRASPTGEEPQSDGIRIPPAASELCTASLSSFGALPPLPRLVLIKRLILFSRMSDVCFSAYYTLPKRTVYSTQYSSESEILGAPLSLTKPHAQPRLRWRALLAALFVALRPRTSPQMSRGEQPSGWPRSAFAVLRCSHAMA